MRKQDKYRQGVVFIALNDDPGSSGALDVEEIKGLISVVLMSELFCVTPEFVAQSVVNYRKRARKQQRST